GNIADPLVEGRDNVFAAVSERFGDIANAGGKRGGKGFGSAVERLLETRKPLIKRAADIVGFRGDPIVEIVEIAAHRLSDILRARAEPLYEFGAIGFHRTIDLREMRRDEVAA